LKNHETRSIFFFARVFAIRESSTVRKFGDTKVALELRGYIRNIVFSTPLKKFFSFGCLFDGYENAIRTWPSTQHPNEKNFFNGVLNTMFLIYPRNSSATLVSPNLRTVELSLIANTRAKKKIDRVS
jgi:hypothetical protein